MTETASGIQTGPKRTMHQECMQALDHALQDNIVGLTADLHKKHGSACCDDNGNMAHFYKGKLVLISIMTGSEFKIEVKNTVKA